MSVQSESGRKDYDKSDHAPKGTRMAGDVSYPSQFRGARGIPGDAAGGLNLKSLQNIQQVDRSNIVGMPDMAKRIQNTVMKPK